MEGNTEVSKAKRKEIKKGGKDERKERNGRKVQKGGTEGRGRRK
jgi:hypothetical protein